MFKHEMFDFSSIFDDVFKTFENIPNTITGTYPPYNMVKLSEDKYQITMAVAGFDRDELKVTVKGGHLFISGEQMKDEEAEVVYIHRGLANRSFDVKFKLADNVEVSEVRQNNGLLTIDLDVIIDKDEKSFEIL